MNELVTFTVPGEAVAKGRPRFSRNGHPYTPEKTASYETLVKWEYARQAKGFRFPHDAELGVRVEAFFAIPKSKSKKMQHDMEIGLIHPTKRPDMDNIVKGICDALNHIAYDDDSAVCYVEASKKYSRTPETRVTIWEL